MLNLNIPLMALLSSTMTFSAEPEVESVAVTPNLTEPTELYSDGLIATVYSSSKSVGTWASKDPIGVPIGEFIDATPSRFSFSDLESDEASWATFLGSHVGVKWSGFLNAEEEGNYVFSLDFVKYTKGDTLEGWARFYANSCYSSIKISDKKLIVNQYKFKEKDDYIGGAETRKTESASIDLEKGYYPLEVWVHCGVAYKWSSWINTAKNAYWDFRVKRPSDRIVNEAPTGVLVWK
ncbi:hypothetical protein [Pseudoalteromonas piscicida]|uniref:hypothetical protein n=1 Tax=Pseudoalteromonas piscicida TaxID=43662 RepID=UPI0032C1E6EE